jgi:hypothetical protein
MPQLLGSIMGWIKSLWPRGPSANPASFVTAPAQPAAAPPASSPAPPAQTAPDQQSPATTSIRTLKTVDGYASLTSVFPGEEIAFHIRNETWLSRIDIYRKGLSDELVWSDLIMEVDGEVAGLPATAYSDGCDWPAAYKLVIPDNCKTGVYVARLSTYNASNEVLFVVKSRNPGAGVLFSITSTTAQAYNPWGGKSLYPDIPPGADASPKVSFDRPGGLDDFYWWEYDFLKWLEMNGMAVDFCTSIDLDRDPALLGRYRLLLSVGHDEYWSKQMRDNVESFRDRGGNIAFFSGNDCYWQIRFEDDYRTIVCYKDLGSDPVKDQTATVNWHADPVSRPGTSLMGVDFRKGGGYWSNRHDKKIELIGFTVTSADHWVFEGTNLKNGDTFGAASYVLSNETDTVNTGTPSNFVVLAEATLTNMPEWPAQPDWPGKATMGIYQKDGNGDNRGIVFTASTDNWSLGLLVKPDASINKITLNVIKKLS